MWFTLHKIQGSYGNLRPSFITRSVVINARYTFVQGVRKQRSGDKNCCYWRVVVCLKMKGNIFLFSSHKYIMHENSSSPIEPMKWNEFVDVELWLSPDSRSVIEKCCTGAGLTNLIRLWSELSGCLMRRKKKKKDGFFSLAIRRFV